MGFNLQTALNAVPPEQRDVVNSRIELVHSAQRRLGMEPRNDSQLTFRYGIDDLEDDDIPSAIANELVVVDKIYNTSSYPLIVEDVLRELADHIKHRYRLSWTDTWEIVRFYGPTMLKLYCFRTSQMQ